MKNYHHNVRIMHYLMSDCERLAITGFQPSPYFFAFSDKSGLQIDVCF